VPNGRPFRGNERTSRFVESSLDPSVCKIGANAIATHTELSCFFMSITSMSSDVQGTAFVHSPMEGSSLPARRPDTATVEQVGFLLDKSISVSTRIPMM
jgi:hypothetical protein